MVHDPLRLFLCGDVMLGRGIDQILPHPGDPALQERYVDDARTYVRLAEQLNGEVPAPVEPSWPWGEALSVLDDAAPAVRIVNLETSVTTADTFVSGKPVHYRMHPENLDALAVVRPDVTVLANNHVLDFDVDGLSETLDVLDRGGRAAVGAGRELEPAREPVAVPVADGRRVLVIAYGLGDSGIPPDWAATEGRPGVAYLAGPSAGAAGSVLEVVERHRRPGDVVVVSVHQGPNWGYDISRHERAFAHALIDGGVDVVHGHSSHHPRPIELYRDRLILYGCGDLVSDYEGIGGHASFRPELRPLYLVDLDPASGTLRGCRIVPMRARRLRLERTADDEVAWLGQRLSEVSRSLGVAVEPDDDGELAVRWGA